MSDEDSLGWLRQIQAQLHSLDPGLRGLIIQACKDNGHELNVFDPARKDERPVACLRCGTIHVVSWGSADAYFHGYADGMHHRLPLFGH